MSLLERKKAELAPGLTVDVDPRNDYVSVKAGAQKFRVNKMDLYTLAFLVADEKVQEALLPVRKEVMMQFRREHTVRLTHDMRAGELLNITCKVDVPQRVVEGIIAGEQAPKPTFRLWPERVSTAPERAVA